MNRLSLSTSPYLLQHAHNPVDWYEWGTEALERAVREKKPILVSIGYSSCHWCHVMERESFEKEDIARIMNEHFVCIKVDREERPDIDQVYMEAVQAMGGHGGWPLNVFLTPSQKPFYGGTYFPPQNWANLLLQINKAFHEKRTEIDASAEELASHLKVTDLNRFGSDTGSNPSSTADLKNMLAILGQRFDEEWGGIEKAPKFVMPSIWLFALRGYAYNKDPHILHLVTHTLTKMSEAGLYDQIRGGFSRYSVDAQWFAPHFEKMLYDNGQLLSLYSEAYAITKDPLFKKIVYDTIGWLTAEMTHPDGGFYSALDADSEGVEGKFYTWTWTELQDTLGPDVAALGKYYEFSKEGNWEHGRNILRRNPSAVLSAEIEQMQRKLLAARNQRVRPGLDDKVLTAWNAIAVRGLLDAYRVFGEPEFLAIAEHNIAFMEDKLVSGNRLFRSYKGKRSSTEGFLEDYAFLIQAYLSLYQNTFKEQYLSTAVAWCEFVLKNFLDEEEGFFHFTGNRAEALIARKKEIFDNVIPGSNSVMARNLFHLGILCDRAEWKQRAMDMVARLSKVIQSEPSYMCHWAVLLTEMLHGMSEVVIVGPEAEQRRRELSQSYLPFSLTLGTTTTSDLSLFEGRNTEDGKTRIFVCFNKTCKLPVETVAEALGQFPGPPAL